MTEARQCPECDVPGEAIEELGDNMKWGCPRCERVWWGSP